MRIGAAALAVTALATISACGSTVQLGAGQGTTNAGAISGDGLNDLSGGTGAVTDGQGSDTGSGTGTTTGGSTGGTDEPTQGPTDAPVIDPGDGGGSTTPSGPVATDKPIQLGFVTTAVSNASGAGLNAGTTITDGSIVAALVKEYNAKGGINGRKITAVVANTDTGGADWASEFQAACAKFTQDNHVSAVLGYVFIYLDNFEQCLAKAGAVHINGGFQPGDIGAQAQFPLMFSVAHPSVDVENLIPLEGALKSGVLTTKTKLGIIYDDCAHGFKVWERTTKPWLDAHKINYLSASGPCSSGNGDVGGAASALAAAELRFASAGVSAVMVSGVPLVLFAQAANTQNYHPIYITALGGAALEPNLPRSQLEKVHGFSWVPAMDVAPGHQPYGFTPAQSACLKMLNNQGLKPKEYNDFSIAWTTCDSLALYSKALTATKGDASASAIAAALHKEIPTFKGAETYGGGLINVKNQRGGAAVYRHYAYSGKCTCFAYTGPTYPVPRV